MYTRPLDYELYHHGIKGMKWGVRRFQKKDGTLTAAGKKRYSGEKIPEKKSTHRQNLEKKYRDQGMSKQEAEQVAAKRIKAEKYVAVAAGVTLAACAAYVAYRGYAVDKVLKSDTNFQRIMSTDPGQAFDMRPGRVYAAYDKRDRDKYKGLLAMYFRSQGKTVHDVSLKYVDGVKVASRKRAEDTLISLYRNDEEFRSAFERSMTELGSKDFGFATEKLRNMANETAKRTTTTKMTDHYLRTKGYDVFNAGLVSRSSAGQKMANKFYDALKKQGVNAIEDINDKKYSGYRSKHPVIIFSGVYNWEQKVMNNPTISSAYRRAWRSINTENAVRTGARYAALYGGTGAALAGIGKISSNAIVNDYRTQHPNTKLTDAQILNNYFV